MGNQGVLVYGQTGGEFRKVPRTGVSAIAVKTEDNQDAGAIFLLFNASGPKMHTFARPLSHRPSLKVGISPS